MVHGLLGGIFDPSILRVYDHGQVSPIAVGNWLPGGQENAEMTITDYNDYIRFENTKYSTANNVSWAKIENYINFKMYKKIKIHVKRAYWGYTYANDISSVNCKFAIVDGNLNDLMNKTFRSLSEETWEIDVSDINVKAKLEFDLQPNSYIEIYSIELYRF